MLFFPDREHVRRDGRRAFLAGLLASTCGPVFSQDRNTTVRPRVYEIPKNGVLDTRLPNAAAPAVAGTAPPALQRPKLSRGMKRRFRQMAAGADAAATSAFRRGLMDLDDFGVHQESVFRLRLASLSETGEVNRVAVLQSKVRRFERVAGRLQRLNQPGAAGWKASVAQARLNATTAKLELALARGDRSLHVFLTSQVRALSKQFYELRKSDYNAGLASEKKMAKAISQTFGAGKIRQAGLTTSQSTARLQQVFGQRGQAVTARPSDATRADFISSTRFQLAKADALAALAGGKLAAAQTAMRTAETQAATQFQQLQQFAKQGTATLFDMTHAWIQRDALQQAFTRAGVETSPQSLRARGQDLSILRQTANAVKDPRGRNIADIALVSSMELLETTQPLRVAVNTKRQAAPQTGTQSKPRIIDLRHLRKQRAAKKPA